MESVVKGWGSRREFLTSSISDMIVQSRDLMTDKGQTLAKLITGLKAFLNPSPSVQQIMSYETGLKSHLRSLAERLVRFGPSDSYEDLASFPAATVEILITKAMQEYVTTKNEEWKRAAIYGIEALKNFIIVSDDVTFEQIMTDDFKPVLLLYQNPSGPYFEFHSYMIEVVGHVMCLSPECFAFFASNGFFEYIRAFATLPSSARALLSCLYQLPPDSIAGVVEFLNVIIQNDDHIMHRYSLKGFITLLHMFGNDKVDVSVPVSFLPRFLEDLGDNQRVNTALDFCSCLSSPPDIFRFLLPIADEFCEFITHKKLALCLTHFAPNWKELMPTEVIFQLCRFAEHEPYESAIECVKTLLFYTTYGANRDLDLQLTSIYIDFLADITIGTLCIQGLRDILATVPPDSEDFAAKLAEAEVLPTLFELASSSDTAEPTSLAARVLINDIGEWLKQPESM